MRVVIFGYVICFLLGLGLLFIFLGIVLLVKGKLGSYLQPRKPTAVAVAALVLGSVAASAGIGILISGWIATSTTSMYYRVAVQINGPGPVMLRLPAPGDPLFWNVLSATNGTSSLRVNHTATDTYVLLSATGDVVFEVRTSVTPPPSNQTVSRISQRGSSYSEWNASIDMFAADSGLTVALSLEIRFDSYCYTLRYDLHAVLRTGAAEYPIMPPVTVVC